MEIDEKTKRTLQLIAASGDIVPFVGSGVSRPGCPGWEGFADKVIEQLIKKAKLDYAQKEELKDLTPRTKLSAVLSTANRGDIDFREIFSGKKEDGTSSSRNPYDYLNKLSRRFVTTNYDEFLDKMPLVSSIQNAASDIEAPSPQKANIFYENEDFTESNLNKTNSVFHIHGSLKKPTAW